MLNGTRPSRRPPLPTTRVISEVGVFAIGGALTDSRLFELCQEQGDSSGSLKFFVSTAPDRPPQYEPNYPEFTFPYRPPLYNGQAAQSGYRY
ncbi:hypothetical protein K438DRAFT_2026984 [Mycena galopus ATCC 62051]|nr:hypothetical protein K438DRAFT_2026984 [Mycena galopus ATCC 62051]